MRCLTIYLQRSSSGVACLIPSRFWDASSNVVPSTRDGASLYKYLEHFGDTG
jgi:hypothetical protein